MEPSGWWRGERRQGEGRRKGKKKKGWERRGERSSNDQTKASHMSTGLGQNLNESRADRFYKFISFIEPLFIIRRGTETETDLLLT